MRLTIVILLDLISAGVILIAVETNGTVIDGVSSRRRDDAWNSCLQTLFLMVDVHPSARDYAIALNGLKQQCEQLKKAGKYAGETGAETGQDGDAAHTVVLQSLLQAPYCTVGTLAWMISGFFIFCRGSMRTFYLPTHLESSKLQQMHYNKTNQSITEST